MERLLLMSSAGSEDVMRIIKNAMAVVASAAVGLAVMAGCAVDTSEPQPESNGPASDEPVGETSEALSSIGNQYTGTCSGTSGQWAGCRGNGCAVC
jgi:hypothetical protein